ncbi:MAG: hypothetical protein CL878_01395 [Dehalococcoidia bacterium]|nr:hypothetical protein [Dehalococcoidia bacterium]
MTQVLIFGLAALVVGTVVAMTGFGLSTSLTPLFALTFPTQIAVMLVAIIHFSNNSFRLYLFRKHVDLALIRRFGILAILGALVGTQLSVQLHSDWLKVVLGVSLMTLGGVEMVYAGWHFPEKWDRAGGVLTGLLGGLVGNQGAIRAAFLANYNIRKEAFIATGTMISTFVDLTRIPQYLFWRFDEIASRWPLLGAVTLCAWGGTYLGKRFVGLVSQAQFKKFVNGMVVFLGVVMIVQGVGTVTENWVYAAGAAAAAIVVLGTLGLLVRALRTQEAAVA